MDFKPPIIRGIDDVLPHIIDNPAFIIADKGWYKVIDYVYNHRDTFNNDYARECRGLKFDSQSGQIIARPYHKFHNLGECAGYHTTDVDLSKQHHVLDKLDGSMVHTCLQDIEGTICPSLYLMTRMGHTNVAQDAQLWLFNSPFFVNVFNMVLKNPNLTFIFEYVGPNNRIVIPYEKEELILTAIRDINTGSYVPYMAMQAFLARYNVDMPVVGYYDRPLEQIAADDVKEGAIVRFENGAMVKIKSDIYCRKHKSKELTESFKGVVQLIIDGNLDDILAQVEPAIQEALQDYAIDLVNSMQVFHEGLRHNLSLRKHLEQKEFALNVQANFPKTTQKLLFMTRKSGDGMAELTKLIKARYNKEADLEELFNELGFPKWQA